MPSSLKGGRTIPGGKGGRGSGSRGQKERNLPPLQLAPLSHRGGVEWEEVEAAGLTRNICRGSHRGPADRGGEGG